MFTIWVGSLVAGLYFAIRKCVRSRQRDYRQTYKADESRISLSNSALDRDGQPRIIQFRVDSWEQERHNVQRVMTDVDEIRMLLTGLGLQATVNRQQAQVETITLEGRVLRPRPTL